MTLQQAGRLLLLTAILVCGLAGMHFTGGRTGTVATSVPLHAHASTAAASAAPSADLDFTTTAARSMSDLSAVEESGPASEETCPTLARAAVHQIGVGTVDICACRLPDDRKAESFTTSGRTAADMHQASMGLQVTDLAVRRT
ncbi:MAG TPA: hypothetical protein VJ777_10630 [Mycobacterium sp.]|nr:hypothetical protein [Mycobacterium sp.]